MKKRTQKKQTDIKAFFKDLARLDRKLLIVLLLTVFISFFISQKNLFVITASGVVFGIKTKVLEEPVINSSPISVPDPSFYPKKTTDIPAPDVSAASAIVIDANSQVVLYQKNQNVRFPPASTTKIMTALVAMDHFNFYDILVVPQITTEGVKIGLVSEEQISFESLLYGLLLNSGNDAAETIAKNAPNGYDGSIVNMNEKAKELNLINTHFVDATGMAFENHYTTAIDLGRLASFALKNQELAKIVATKRMTVSDVTGAHVYNLENLNKLLSEVAGADGIKTGYTEEAGQVLVAAATRDEHTIITVVLKSEDRFLDSKNLLEWAFANYTFTPAIAL